MSRVCVWGTRACARSCGVEVCVAVKMVAASYGECGAPTAMPHLCARWTLGCLGSEDVQVIWSTGRAIDVLDKRVGREPNVG